VNPLDQLADIQIPDQVGMWPLAIGYWIVLFSLLVACALTYYCVQRYKQKRVMRNRSLSALAGIDANDPSAARQVHHILKTAATAYLPSADVLHIHGNAWQQLLKRLYTKSDKQEVCESLSTLAKWQYDQRIDLPDNQLLIRHASLWISHALPPKKGAADV
jgi:hypothetical protein